MNASPLQEPVAGSFLTLFQEDAGSLRAFRRFSLDLTIGVGILGVKQSVRAAAHVKPSATLTNASMSGLCFSSLEKFQAEALILIEIELGRQIHRVPAIVRRCAARKKLGRTFYECGAQYVKSDATFLFLPLMAHYLRLRVSEF